MALCVIDLGTNTFHLLIAEISNENKIIPLYEEKQGAKIGQGGISKGFITEEAMGRGLIILKNYALKINEYKVTSDNIFAVGTSAIRNAQNGIEFINKIKSETGIDVEIISGEREAELIYCGVKAGSKLTNETSLIIDIGGGSVEFILCNREKIFWKKSFEIGGQRLMDRFMTKDPIPNQNIQKIYEFLEEKLLPLTNAIHQYQPFQLIGSAGTFDTLTEINYQKNDIDISIIHQTEFDLPIENFKNIFLQIVNSDREERLKIPGMIPLRVDMIVVAGCLLNFVINKYKIEKLKTCTFALKEGVMMEKYLKK